MGQSESAEAAVRRQAAARDAAVVAVLAPAPANAAANAAANPGVYRQWSSMPPADFGASGDASVAARKFGLSRDDLADVLRELSEACATRGVTLPIRKCSCDECRPLLVSFFILLGLVIAVVGFTAQVWLIAWPANLGIVIPGIILSGVAERALHARHHECAVRNEDAADALTAALDDSTAGRRLASQNLRATVVPVDTSSKWQSISACQLFLIISRRGGAAGAATVAGGAATAAGVAAQPQASAAVARRGGGATWEGDDQRTALLAAP